MCGAVTAFTAVPAVLARSLLPGMGIATVYIYVAIPTFMHQLYSGDVSWDEAVANDYEARENSVCVS